MAEAFDVADRGRFYDKTGAVRDVVQNHMLQVLATVLMDPPPGGGLDELRSEKAEVVKALTPLTTKDAVRGQYEGYHEVEGVAPDSTTETFVALRLASESWRWAGVPILIRAGKCMPVTATEVVVHFHKPPHNVFGLTPFEGQNILRFRLWPETQMGITVASKKPGGAFIAQSEELAFDQPAGEDMRPYDRLIGAALDGEQWLFARQDTVESAWVVVDAILDDAIPVTTYAKGTWPIEADSLLPEGVTWYDPKP
jgi:glucose-6-phosphate 1-dehydrogenase